MKNYVEELRKKKANMGNRIARLSGMIRACKDEIAKNNQIKSGALGMVSEAKSKGLVLVAAAQSRRAGRMAEANLTSQDLLAKMELLYRVLCKYQEVAAFLIEDMTQEVDVKERKRAMAREAHSAIKSAMAILNGDDNARQLYDMASEYVAADYAMRIGEIDDFVRLSDSFIQSVDLQNGVYEQRALEMLSDWERNAESIVLGDSKRLLIEGNPAAESSRPAGGPASPNNGKEPPSLDWFGQTKK